MFLSRKSLLVCLFLFAIPAFGASRSWTGAVSDLWSVGGNWAGGVAPVNGDDLVFPEDAVNLSPTNDLVGLTIGSVSFPQPFPGMFSAYVISGNVITITGGITSVCCMGHWNLPVTLGASQTFDVNDGLRFNSTIALAGNTLTIDPTFHLNGTITGAGDVVLHGDNRLVVEGSITIGGTIALTTNADLNVGGPISAALVTGGVNSIISGDDTLPATTLNGATLRPGEELGGSGDPEERAILTTGPLSMTGGAVALDLVNATPGSGHDQLVVNGTVTLNAPTLQINLPGSIPAAGTAFVIIANDGVDAVSGTFAGLPEGATFAAESSTSFQITYTGGTGNDVVVTVLSGPKSWTGAVSNLWSVGGNWSGGVAPVNGDELVFPSDAVNLLPNNDIVGLTLDSVSFPQDFASIFSGYDISGNVITITGGITAVCCVGNWNLPVTLGASQTFDVNDGLRFNNTIALSGNTLTIDPSFRLNGSITGAGNIVVHGENRLVVEGSITISGSLALTTNGDLNVGGPISAAVVTGGAGSIISGDDTLPATTLNGATLRPGEELGGTVDPEERAILTTGPLSMTGGTVALDLVNATPGSGHDQLAVNGTVTLNAPTLQINVPGPIPPIGTSFVILANDGADPVSGTFAGLPEGAVFTADGTLFQITYLGGTGNDVVLTAVVAPASNVEQVPTLSTWMMLLLTITLAVVGLRVRG